MTPGFTIRADGRFSIEAGALKLAGAYPSMDHRAVAPLRVETDARTARYHLADGGRLTLGFTRDEQTLRMAPVQEGSKP